MPYKKCRGFILLELIVVIIIIGILAAFSLPQFTKTKERALGKEAIANLKLIAVAERISRMESTTNGYTSCSCSNFTNCNNTTNGCNYLLRLSLTTQNWTYRVRAAGRGAGATFTAYGDRVNTAPRPYRNCVYSLDNDADGEPDPNNTRWCP